MAGAVSIEPRPRCLHCSTSFLTRSRDAQNSNLVLTAETRTREAAEPSGEPETLWGRMPGKMGDRVQYGKPEGLEDRKAKQRKKCALGGRLL
jgi:hypothetical protein